MAKLLTYVYSYYDNPNMLKEQIRIWSSYDQKVKNQLEIIVTDDCSTQKPIDDVFPFPEDLTVRVFRVTKKAPWNWLACRNIGAHYASGDWLLLTDMDHVMQLQHIRHLVRLLKKQLDPRMIFTFSRIDAPNNTTYKPHNDSFLMTKQMYWKVGGYDEELSGNYGTSGNYRRRAYRICEGNLRLSIPLTRYPREVISDSSTTEFDRKLEGNAHKRAVTAIINKKVAENRQNDIKTLTFPYEELNPWK